MKITYEFVTGEISEVEVDESLGGMLLAGPAALLGAHHVAAPREGDARREGGSVGNHRRLHMFHLSRIVDSSSNTNILYQKRSLHSKTSL